MLYVNYLILQYITTREYFIYLFGLAFLGLLIRKFISYVNNTFTPLDKKITILGIIMGSTSQLLMLFLDVREPYLLEYPAIADSLGIIVHICGLIYIIIF